MNLKQLETFLQIAQQGSFAAAADALHTTQSNVSARIKDLEHDLGVALFDRSAHRAQLTAKGRELLERSQELIGALDQLRDRIADRQALSGVLRLGVVGVVAGTWLPALVKELRSRHPALEIEIDFSLTKVLVQRLREGAVDVAIVAGTVGDDDLRSEVVGEDRFAWMASSSLGIAARSMTPRELSAYPLIAYTAESYHHAVVRKWFRSASVRFRPAITCNRMDVMSQLVEQGLGVAFLPSDYYGSEIAQGRMVVIEPDPPIAPAAFTLLSSLDRQNSLVSAVTDAVHFVRQSPRGDAA